MAATDDKPADCAKVRPPKPLTNAELCQAMSDVGMRRRSDGQTIIVIVTDALLEETHALSNLDPDDLRRTLAVIADEAEQ